jgi:hypothetical protein
MRLLILAFFAAALLGCKTARDPIGDVIGKIPPSEQWEKGTFTIIQLPASAKAVEVVEVALLRTVFGGEQWVDSTIAESRTVHLGSSPDSYNAALVKTHLGRKIVIFRYVGPPFGWVSRVYDAGTGALRF